MKFLGILFTCILLSAASFAQSDTTSRFHNNFQLEAMGAGGFLSIKYERLHHRTSWIRSSISAGIGFIPKKDDFWKGYVNVPLEYNLGLDLNFNSDKISGHYLEGGMGWLRLNFETKVPGYTGRQWRSMGFLRLGYRYDFPGTRLMARVSYNPVFSTVVGPIKEDYRTGYGPSTIYREVHGTQVTNWAAMSVGFKF